MDNQKHMRDEFIGKMHELAKKDRNVVMVNADMGAPALDLFRLELPQNFVNVGIAEQNMIAVATGLALEGKKVYTFAIAPFTTSRCHEFIKLNAGLMKIPINILGVGAGVGYDDSGPTHHLTEDITIMRAIPNLEIYSPSYSDMAKNVSEIVYKSPNPTYTRLDRKLVPDLSKYYQYDDFTSGFKELEKGGEIAIIATGNMVHNALEIRKKFLEKGRNIGVIDIYRLKPISTDLKNTLAKYKAIVSIEEHLLDGGFGSIIAEIIMDGNLNTKLKRIGLKDYFYIYGRENIQKRCRIDVNSVVEEIEKI
ncbi:MAG: 1-deoxy-D-xylulose-5-phosphate synthase [Nanoarchaeota archaeon]|nr:1-deoxy-D-xylulose-5-phosphate synthase [Nanoarchaeota archaeon]MBU1028060.1 1-deoxy-D-xylulose-5-phosphate synthase [Nanoarchaeota archaeon]